MKGSFLTDALLFLGGVALVLFVTWASASFAWSAHKRDKGECTIPFAIDSVLDGDMLCP